MRLPVKLALLLAATAALPLLLAATFTLPSGRVALRGQMDQIYAQDARALAAEVHRTLVDKLDSLTLAASTLRLGELDPEAREQALLLIYKETRAADVVGLFDGNADALGATIHFANLTGDLATEHERVDDAALSAYAGKVPLQGALQAGLAVGPVYVLPDAQGRPIPRLVLAVAVAAAREGKWVLAVEISLRRLAESFERFRPGESGAAFLVDGEGKVIVHPDRDLVFRQANLRDHPLLRGLQSDELLGANATVPLLGWKPVVQEPADEALRPLRRLRVQSLFFVAVGLLAAFLLALFAARTVTRPVAQLRDAALAVTSGQLETEVPVQSRGELGELQTAFNAMTRGLRERESLKATLALSASLELTEVLDRLLDSLARAVAFDEAAVMITARDGMNVVVSRGARSRDEARRIMPAAPFVQRAIATLQPAMNEGRQLLAVPLIQRGVVIGVVCLESRRPFDPSQTALALSCTQPAAMAVENARLFDEVQRLATVDGLTGVHNRRHFSELAQMAFDSARRFGQPLTAVMLDVDHFKDVNDRYGHAVGDQVLRALAERCKATLRSIDVLGRYGGEEFAVILPGTRSDTGGTILAERIRQRVAEQPFTTDVGAVSVTVSVGIAGVDPQMRDLADVLKLADQALYEAKQAGRNRVVERALPVAQKPVA